MTAEVGGPGRVLGELADPGGEGGVHEGRPGTTRLGRVPGGRGQMIRGRGAGTTEVDGPWCRAHRCSPSWSNVTEKPESGHNEDYSRHPVEVQANNG